MREFELIQLIHERCAVARNDVRLGIGDDGAILAPPAGHELIISTDTLVAGIHFPPQTAAEDIGWKSLAVNLSDLAAMGATPAWALLALTLPTADNHFVECFADGFAELASQHHVALVGGDTTRGTLSITVTVLGFVPVGQALRRDGAQPGDLVFVTGTLGDAAAGLRCLDTHAETANGLLNAPPGMRENLLQRLNRPIPRIAAGCVLRDVASACIDISDGLVADLSHIANKSGVGIEIDAARLPASSALLTLFDSATQINFQLAGGDDYELAFSVAPMHAQQIAHDLATLGCGVTHIGRVVTGLGVRILNAQGDEIAIAQQGWEHFA